MTKPRTPEEIAYDVWVAVHTPGNLSREVIFAALREAAAGARTAAEMAIEHRETECPYCHEKYMRPGVGFKARVAELERKLAEARAESEGRCKTLFEKSEEVRREWERAEKAEAEIERLRAEREELVTAVRELLEHVETENADVIGAIQAAWLALTPRS